MKLLNMIADALFGSIDRISESSRNTTRTVSEFEDLIKDLETEAEENLEEVIRDWEGIEVAEERAEQIRIANSPMPDQLMMTTSTIQTTRENLPGFPGLSDYPRPEMISLSDGFRDPKLVDKEIEAKKEEPTKRPKRKLDI